MAAENVDDYLDFADKIIVPSNALRRSRLFWKPVSAMLDVKILNITRTHTHIRTLARARAHTDKRRRTQWEKINLSATNRRDRSRASGLIVVSRDDRHSKFDVADYYFTPEFTPDV